MTALLPVVLVILLSGLILHITVLVKWINSLNRKRKVGKSKEKDPKYFYSCTYSSDFNSFNFNSY